MKLALVALLMIPAGCSTGYSHWGVAPDDAAGMSQADSACDFGRGSNDPASHCFVSRRKWNDPSATKKD